MQPATPATSPGSSTTKNWPESADSLLGKVSPAANVPGPVDQAEASSVRPGSRSNLDFGEVKPRPFHDLCLSNDHRDFLRKPQVTKACFESNQEQFKDFFEESVGKLKVSYQEEGLSTEGFKTVDKGWNDLVAHVNKKYFSKEELMPMAAIIDFISKVSQDQPTGGFLSKLPASQIQRLLCQQVSGYVNEGCRPVMLEYDELGDNVAALKDQKAVTEGEFFLPFADRLNYRDEKDWRLVGGAFEEGTVAAISHLKSGVNNPKVRKDNLSQIEKYLGSQNEAVHFSDINIDISKSEYLKQVFEVASKKGYDCIISEGRYEKTRGGVNEQCLKEEPIEAESMIIFVQQSLGAEAGQDFYKITSETDFDSLKFTTKPIFSEALPGDHNPVLMKLEGQDYVFLNLVGTKSGPGKFNEADLSSQQLGKMNQIHALHKRECVPELQALQKLLDF